MPSFNLLRFLVVLTVAQSYKCLTIRKDAAKDIHKTRNEDKNKSKKSVETLYTIENDLNRMPYRGDGYEYYVPEKFVKPHVEQAEVDDPPEIKLPPQGLYRHEQNYIYPNHLIIDPSQLLHQREQALSAALAANPLLAALFVGQTLDLPQTAGAGAAGGYNHAAHLPINPYVALLLSHYGRYVQPAAVVGRHQRGIYGYAAANNYHNNKPFGAYKIYEDAK